jgi:D-galactarolactone isomerase
MITDAELKILADGGIRGIRFSLTNPVGAPTSIDMIEPLSKRVNALGWHVQINMTADQIVAAADLWNRLPSVIVFDHMGHNPQPIGLRHPVFNVIRRLVDKGRTWVKLSVTSDNTADGPPGYTSGNTSGPSTAVRQETRAVEEARRHGLKMPIWHL